MPDTNLWNFLFEDEKRDFPQDHVIFTSNATGEEYTYNDVRSKALDFGHNLKTQWDWQNGDVLLVISPNSIDLPAIYWVCHWAGGIVTPANPRHTPKDLQYQIVHSGAKGIVVHAECLDVVLKVSECIKFPIPMIRVIGAYSHSSDGPKHIGSMLTRTLQVVSSIRTVVDPSETAFLVYSSGTTGLPKGAMVPHANVVAALIAQKKAEGPFVDWTKDCILALLPVYHIFGLICLIHIPIYLGIKTVVMEKFLEATFPDVVQSHLPTHIYVAPPVVLSLAKAPGTTRAKFSSVRMITSGGAPLSVSLISAVYNRIGVPLRQAFGLTETSAVCHIQRWDSWDTAMGSNGPPLPGISVQFLSEDGTLSRDGPGELWIRGLTVFRGYYKNEQANSDSFTKDRWFKSGDIGYQDAQGNLYITDRVKDFINFKGFKISPTEIETVLQDHPAVQDVAVIALFNPDIESEVPVAYVVLHPSVKAHPDTAKQLVSHVAGRLASHKKLRGGVIWTKQIPKAPLERF